MSFAQLPYWESLRDIKACLSASEGTLYHMGFRSSVSRSTLADANEGRDWRIYAEFAQCLICQGFAVADQVCAARPAREFAPIQVLNLLRHVFGHLNVPLQHTVQGIRDTSGQQLMGDRVWMGI